MVQGTLHSWHDNQIFVDMEIKIKAPKDLYTVIGHVTSSLTPDPGGALYIDSM